MSGTANAHEGDDLRGCHLKSNICRSTGEVVKKRNRESKRNGPEFRVLALD